MNTLQKISACCAAASLLGSAAWHQNRGDQTAEVESPRRKNPPPVSTAMAVPDSDSASIPTTSTLRNFDPERLLQEIATTQDQEVLVLVETIYNALDRQAKGSAADALAARGGFEAVANLLRVAAMHENLDDRAAILEGLKNLNAPEDFATLASTLAATQDMQVVDAVVQELSRSNSPSMVATLVDLYRERNDSSFQKNQILRAISALRHPDLFRPLGKLANWAEEPALAEAARCARSAIRGEMPMEEQHETES